MDGRIKSRKAEPDRGNSRERLNVVKLSFGGLHLVGHCPEKIHAPSEKELVSLNPPNEMDSPKDPKMELYLSGAFPLCYFHGFFPPPAGPARLTLPAAAADPETKVRCSRPFCRSRYSCTMPNDSSSTSSIVALG